MTKTESRYRILKWTMAFIFIAVALTLTLYKIPRRARAPANSQTEPQYIPEPAAPAQTAAPTRTPARKRHGRPAGTQGRQAPAQEVPPS
jgi:hypothetical protein